MKKIKLGGGYALLVSEYEAYLVKGVMRRRSVCFSAVRCDLIGRRDENGERLLICVSGEARVPVLTDAVIALSRIWRDGGSKEIFLETDSSKKETIDAAENAEYVECRRVIRGAGDFDTVLYKRHTDR